MRVGFSLHTTIPHWVVIVLVVLGLIWVFEVMLSSWLDLAEAWLRWKQRKTSTPDGSGE